MQPLVPVTGQRQSVKVFGCVEIHSAQFLYRRDSVFNADTYLDFLEQVARYDYPRRVFWVQDNASYTKDAMVWDWFAANRFWWTVFNLPPYSPEYNATERLWHHTRITGTHNRYFANAEEINTTLTRVFRSIQRCPEQIRQYLRPFA
jgi:transposase